MTTPGIQSGAAAAATTVGTPTAPGKTITTTEEQAKAIICAAQRAMEEAKSGGGGGGSGALSLKKSLEWFLEERCRNKSSAAGDAGIQRHLDDSSSSSAPRLRRRRSAGLPTAPCPAHGVKRAGSPLRLPLHSLRRLPLFFREARSPPLGPPVPPTAQRGESRAAGGRLRRCVHPPSSSSVKEAVAGRGGRQIQATPLFL